MPDSATLASQLAAYNANPVTSTGALNDALGQFGVPEIRNTVSGLRTTVANTTAALNNVDPSVTGRTQGSLVTEAQREAQVNNERAPIAQNLTDENNSLNQNQSDLTDAENQASQLAGNEVSDYNAGRTALQDEYTTEYQKEQDAASQAAAQAAAAEQQREFNVSNSTKLATSGGSTALPTKQAATASTKQFLEGQAGSDGHVAPSALANAYNQWINNGLSDADFWSNFQGYWNPTTNAAYNGMTYKDAFNKAKG